MSAKKRIVVLISGSGSNLQALLDKQEQLNGEIVAVISNRPGAYGLERAANAGVENTCVDHTLFADRESFDAALAETIDQYRPDLVILAGFMRILTPGFVKHYLGRLFNIHPSLLPKYPGLNTHQRALDAGDSEHGVTVHFVTPQLDGGPAVLQGRIAVRPGDTAQSLQERIHKVEHQIYPKVVQWFCENRLELRDDRVVLDSTILPEAVAETYQV